jgi:hypothetical protein
VIGKLQAGAAESVRPELEAALDEVASLRAELDAVRTETRAEIELLWAELEARRPPEPE